MNIECVTGAIRVGEVTLDGGEYTGNAHTLYKKKLGLIYDDEFPKELKTKHVSMVYLLVVNDEIVKIGQSSCKGGIKSCMAFYLNAGTDDPGVNRFAINWMMRDELNAGNKVEVFMLYMEPIEVEVPGLMENKKVIVPVSAKGMEETCIEQYIELEGDHPKWNYQESGTPLPKNISEAFGDYKTKRAEER